MTVSCNQVATIFDAVTPCIQPGMVFIDMSTGTVYKVVNSTYTPGETYRDMIDDGKIIIVANDMSQLQKVEEDGKIGWRLLGRDPDNYGDIGNEAIDLSSSGSPSATAGSTGDYSFAVGQSVEASGVASVATGRRTRAIGYGTFSTGEGTIVSEDCSMAIGKNNIDAPGSAFVVGNGYSEDSRSNALEILFSGKIIAPSLDIALIVDDKSLVTKEYVEQEIASGGGGTIVDGGTF